MYRYYTTTRIICHYYRVVATTYIIIHVVQLLMHVLVNQLVKLLLGRDDIFTDSHRKVPRVCICGHASVTPVNIENGSNNQNKSER